MKPPKTPPEFKELLTNKGIGLRRLMIEVIDGNSELHTLVLRHMPQGAKREAVAAVFWQVSEMLPNPYGRTVACRTTDWFGVTTLYDIARVLVTQEPGANDDQRRRACKHIERVSRLCERLRLLKEYLLTDEGRYYGGEWDTTRNRSTSGSGREAGPDSASRYFDGGDTEA